MTDMIFILNNSLPRSLIKRTTLTLTLLPTPLSTRKPSLSTLQTLHNKKQTAHYKNFIFLAVWYARFQICFNWENIKPHRLNTKIVTSNNSIRKQVDVNSAEICVQLTAIRQIKSDKLEKQ